MTKLLSTVVSTILQKMCFQIYNHLQSGQVYHGSPVLTGGYKLVLQHQLIISHFTYQFTAPGNNAKEEGLTSFCPLQPCPQLNHLLTSYTNLMVCSSTNLRGVLRCGALCFHKWLLLIRPFKYRSVPEPSGVCCSCMSEI